MYVRTQEKNANPRFATLLPIIQPFTNKIALYGCPRDSSKVKLSIASIPVGRSNLNVEMKNPTPAALLGRPLDRSREAHPLVENPGRCHPCRSPKRPPSLKTPRVLSGKLNEVIKLSARDRREHRSAYAVYPPILPWTFHAPNLFPSKANPLIPRGLLELSVLAVWREIVRSTLSV